MYNRYDHNPRFLSPPARRSSDLPAHLPLHDPRPRSDVGSPLPEHVLRTVQGNPCPVTGAGSHAGSSRSVEKRDRKSTRLNSSHVKISYAVFYLKKITLTLNEKTK